MKHLLLLMAMWTVVIEAGQLVSPYNLISSNQILYQPMPLPYSLVAQRFYSSGQGNIDPHPVVLATQLDESSISNKKSSRFYDNPYVSSALAKESLQFNKEMLVRDRPTENIDRSQIVKLINSLNRVHYE